MQRDDRHADEEPGQPRAVSNEPDDIGWDWVTNQNTSKVTVDAAKCN